MWELPGNQQTCLKQRTIRDNTKLDLKENIEWRPSDSRNESWICSSAIKHVVNIKMYFFRLIQNSAMQSRNSWPQQNKMTHERCFHTSAFLSAFFFAAFTHRRCETDNHKTPSYLHVLKCTEQNFCCFVFPTCCLVTYGTIEFASLQRLITFSHHSD